MPLLTELRGYFSGVGSYKDIAPDGARKSFRNPCPLPYKAVFEAGPLTERMVTIRMKWKTLYVSSTLADGAMRTYAADGFSGFPPLTGSEMDFLVF